jgi:hypothetical protein
LRRRFVPEQLRFQRIQARHKLARLMQGALPETAHPVFIY